jgi:hypothetical protein
LPIQVIDVRLLDAPDLAAFNIDLPTRGAVEEGYNLTLSGWALAPTGPPPSVALALVGSPNLIDGLLTESRLHGTRQGVGDHYADIPRAHECSFLFYCSLVGLPTDSDLLLSARLEDGRLAPMARLQVRRNLIPRRGTNGIRPVLMSCPGRSGSTWLTRLLGQHPQGVAHRPFEREPRVASYWMEVFRALSGPTGYSRAIQPVVTSSADWWIEGRGWLQHVDVGGDPHLHNWLVNDSVEDVAAFCRARIEGFYRSVACEDGKDRPSFFVERSVHPRLTALVHELFPGTTELHLIRDPRDILASRLSFIDKTANPKQFGRDAAGSNEEYVREHFAREMTHALHRWEAADNQALKIRYEDLIEDPHSTLERIFRHLDVDASTETVQQVFDGASQQTPERQEMHLTAPSQQSSVGRWRQDLDETLLAACEETLGDVIRAFGYAD